MIAFSVAMICFIIDCLLWWIRLIFAQSNFYFKKKSKIWNGFRVLSRSTVKSKKRRLDMQQLCMLYSGCLHAFQCRFQTATFSQYLKVIFYYSYDFSHIACKVTMNWFKCIILKGSSPTYNYRYRTRSSSLCSQSNWLQGISQQTPVTWTFIPNHS